MHFQGLELIRIKARDFKNHWTRGTPQRMPVITCQTVSFTSVSAPFSVFAV